METILIVGFGIIILLQLLLLRNSFLTLKQVNKMNPTVTALQAEVTNNTSVEQSAVTLLQNLAKQLAAALAQDAADNGIDPTDLTAAQTLLTTLQQNDAALAAAVTANTPAASSSGTGTTGTGTGSGSGPTTPTPLAFTDNATPPNQIVVQASNGTSPSVGDNVTVNGSPITSATSYTLSNGGNLSVSSGSTVLSYTAPAGS